MEFPAVTVAVSLTASPAVAVTSLVVIVRAAVVTLSDTFSLYNESKSTDPEYIACISALEPIHDSGIA